MFRLYILIPRRETGGGYRNGLRLSVSVSLFLLNFDQFSLNFSQMFLSVRRCAEPMTQLRRLKVTVNFKVMGFTLEFCACSISPQPIQRFSSNFTQMFLLMRHVQNPWLNYADSRSSAWDSVAGYLAALQSAVLYLLAHLSWMLLGELFSMPKAPAYVICLSVNILKHFLWNL